MTPRKYFGLLECVSYRFVIVSTSTTLFLPSGTYTMCPSRSRKYEDRLFSRRILSMRLETPLFVRPKSGGGGGVGGVEDLVSPTGFGPRTSTPFPSPPPVLGRLFVYRVKDSLIISSMPSKHRRVQPLSI